MRIGSIALALVAGFAAVLAGSPAFGQAVPQIAFDSVPDAIKLPKDMYLGEASGDRKSVV